MSRRLARVRPTGRFGLAAALVALGVVLAARAARAQDAVQAALERRGPISAEAREQLYAQLRQQAEILEAHAAVVKTVSKLVGPTVVHIEADVTARTALLHGSGRHVEEAGSGVIVEVDAKFYVLTNRHVVHGAPPEKIEVNLADGRQVHPARGRVWEDVETDVAVLEIAAPDLVAARVGDSDAMAIGDFVLAVGSPFGLSYSVTYGIISAKGRRGLELGQSGVGLQDFIQTDAAINPGNSGGPLVNLRGEVIGLNTAIASNSGGSEGIGFAIPINMFMHVARQLIREGKASRAYLGVTLDRHFGPTQAAQLGLPRRLGARIIEIRPNSPAAAADLQVDDVILQIDGTPIDDDDHLVNVVKLTEVDKEISIVVLRGGKQLVRKVRLGSADS